MTALAGRKALVAGVANDSSIAWGCARALKAAGADIAMTYLNEKADRFVRPLAEAVGAEIYLPLDVEDDAQHDALFAAIAEKWGGLDVLVHAIAFCPREDLHGRVIDCSSAGFAKAMDVSVHSFLRMMRRAEPLLRPGAACVTMTFQGSTSVVPSYGVMGPVKAALESAVRYLAYELGGKGVSVHALSPGPMPTRAGGGISGFDAMLADAEARAPMRRLSTLEDCGAACVWLAAHGAAATGGVHLIDGGFNIIA
ncbi:MAG: enoyl-[acyl-carrier-protein] reductase FabI [Rhodobacteraceae bacterium]|nr:MAG: enoyl-[acyl-carrier-protein] reductase FabI [Paracoccaceae bacterium]